jgi:dimethylglycine catabolism B
MNGLRRALELCEFCPKMCRFACPVSEATSREAFTPWGKVSLAALSGRAPEASAALAFGACTGCLRCQTYCAHSNDVPALLYAARAGAVRVGTAPREWAEVARGMARSGHAEEVDLGRVLREIATATPTVSATPTPTASATPTPTVSATPTESATRSPRASALRVVAGAVTALLRPAEQGPRGPMLFPGCDALAQGGKVAREALAVARAVGAPLELVPEGALCCGLKLVEAGYPEMFAAHAARVRSILVGPGRRPGPVHLVLLSPGCARTVREKWPALPDGSKVEHVTTYLSRALAARPDLRERPPLPGSVAFHDPCELARGLSELTAPRALLAAAVEEIREPLRCADDASCCGADGLLPRTLPAAARAIALDRRRELDACGASPVTASPACAAILGAEDVVSVLARWLGVGVEEAP